MKTSKISFCTVCRNRLHHLKKTLPQNIADNKDYDEVEFIVLDYNSSDELEEFIETNMQEHIISGKLIYYKTTQPSFFHRSHSRNLSFKLATGDIVCNIDADNYTGKSFAAFINQSFEENSEICLNTTEPEQGLVNKDVLGRICVLKKDFLAIRGFDESMHNYGYEDFDLVNRLKLSGIRSLCIKDMVYLHAISHSDKERISEEHNLQQFNSLLLNYIDESTSQVLLLFNNHEYNFGTIRDIMSTYARYPEKPAASPERELRQIKEKEWSTGLWEKEDQLLRLSHHTGNDTLQYDEIKKCFISNYAGSGFYEITDLSMIEQAIFSYSQRINKKIMENNKLNRNIIVNTEEFGKAIVYKNFDNKTPIHI